MVGCCSVGFAQPRHRRPVYAGPTIVSASVCGSTTGNQELCCYLRELTEIDRVSGMRAHTRYSAGRSAQPVEHFVLVGEVQNPTQQGEQLAVAVLHSWTASLIHATLPAAVHASCALCDSSSQHHQTVFRRVSATTRATSPAVGTESAGLPRSCLPVSGSCSRRGRSVTDGHSTTGPWWLGLGVCVCGWRGAVGPSHAAPRSVTSRAGV